MTSNCVTRDNHGRYTNDLDDPGPSLMGANTLLGNDVCNNDGDKLFAMPWAGGVHQFYGTTCNQP